MQEFTSIKAIINDMKIIIDTMKDRKIGIEDLRNMQLATVEINNILYHSDKLRCKRITNIADETAYLEYIEELEWHIAMWEQTLKRRSGNAVDIEFWDIYEFFKYVEIDTVYQMVVVHFMSLPEWQRIEYLSLSYRYTWMQRKLDFVKGDFSLIEQYVELMVNEVENYKWLYERLADNRSKMVLNGIIRYWFEFDINKLHSLTETVFPDYYDLDILECGENDVLVDLGAFIGDSVCDYIKMYGTYRRIYAYEITPSTYQTLVENISQYPNIVTRQKGVGSKNGKMYLNEETSAAGNHLKETGNIEVEVVTLDEDIKESVTVIKMDIEGAEKDAIIGAKNHILQEKPKLLVSSYHIPEDIFEIPRLISEIRDDYKFYMRFNGSGLWPCDYVIFAV